MFMPISQYYATAPEKKLRKRRKELKSQNIPLPNDVNQNEENGYSGESSTVPSIATTSQYDELSLLSSSSPSSIDHSNNNRI